MRPDLDAGPRQVVKRAALRENLLRNEKRGQLGALAAVWQRTLPLKEQMDRIRSDVEAGLDEGVLLLCLPNSWLYMYGESLCIFFCRDE